MEKKATGNSSSFKNFDKTFNFKAHFTCDSSNLVYVGKNTPAKLEFVKLNSETTFESITTYQAI